MALRPKLSHVEYSIDMSNASVYERKSANILRYDKQFLATPRGLESALEHIKKIENLAARLHDLEADDLLQRS